nr:hypothetical protein [Tanacetum cinerariifolium]
MEGESFTPNQGLRNFKDATNTGREKPNFNWAHSQTFSNRQNRSISVHSCSYQMRLENALLDFNSDQEKRLSHLRTQLGQQHDDMIVNINLLWKTIFEKVNDVSALKNGRNSMAPKSIVAMIHVEKEELKKKGIKSPSKLFSPKYLSPASIKELNENPSAPKLIYFVNSIIILSKYNDTEKDVSSTDICRHNLEIFKQTKLMGVSTDSIPSLAYEGNFSNERTYYYQSLLIEDEYRQDEGDRRGVRNLKRLEKEMMDDKGEVM